VPEQLFVGEGFDGKWTKASAESGERGRKAAHSIVKTSRRRFDFPFRRTRHIFRSD